MDRMVFESGDVKVLVWGYRFIIGDSSWCVRHPAFHFLACSKMYHKDHLRGFMATVPTQYLRWRTRLIHCARKLTLPVSWTEGHEWGTIASKAESYRLFGRGLPWAKQQISAAHRPIVWQCMCSVGDVRGLGWVWFRVTMGGLQKSFQNLRQEKRVPMIWISWRAWQC